jgi:hypothetical protein
MSVRMIWSESQKMMRVMLRGKRTSRKRILYAQMIRCFSVCLCNQVGHLYVTISTCKNEFTLDGFGCESISNPQA